MDDLYARRLLTEGHPDFAARAVETFTHNQDVGEARAEIIRWTVSYLAKVRALPAGSRFAVVGCGPRPLTCTQLAGMGFDVTAVEPLPAFVEAAREHVAGAACILQGSAERIPLADESQDVVLCESVLEHVESPRLSLTEMYRVLRRGGAAWVLTTNKWRFSPRGRNDEYSIPFFNWLPPLLQEAFVFHHLHYDPSLANYSRRPAVHWFTYAGLCRAGRDVGFSRFYSILDLASPADPRLRGSGLRRALTRFARRRPLVRALALTQLGGTIVMVKE